MGPLLIHDMLDAVAVRTPNRVASVHNDKQYTFTEVRERSFQIAAALAKRGVRRGDRVTWWADISIEAGPLYYGLGRLGAIFTPLNPKFTAAEADAVYDLTDPVLRLHDDRHGGDLTIDALLGAGVPSTLDDSGVLETDGDVIFTTSGTTGAPKGVLLAHRSNRMRLNAPPSAPFGPTLTMFPLFHWGGWSFIHSAWAASDTHVLTDSTDADTLLAAIERHQVTRFYAIPGVWRRILALLATDPTRYDLSSLKEANTGTSATPPDLLRAIHDALPHTTTSIGYGATEAGSLAWLSPQDVWRKPGSTGLPSPGQHVRFVEGEMWVKGPQMSLGYFRNPEANAAAFVDGWYRTGDLVDRDDEGYLYVVGRIKDVIRTGGEFVAPAEVDVVLMRHPAIFDAAVAGVPHPDWGEVVTAFAVARPGMTLDLASIRAHCEGALASHKHPRALHLVEAIPRTGPTGQVQRRLLVEIALHRTDQ